MSQVSEPYGSYETEELRCRVEDRIDGADALGRLVGGRVLGVTTLKSVALGEDLGLVVRTSRGDVAIIDEAGDLSVDAWPDLRRWPTDRIVEAS